jgi:hypothetical protein
MNKNKSFKNEWHLFIDALKTLQANKNMVLKMIEVELHTSNRKKQPALQCKNTTYLTNQLEIEKVFDLLYETIDAVIITDHTKKTFSIYTPENAPEHVCNFPF